MEELCPVLLKLPHRMELGTPTLILRSQYYQDLTRIQYRKLKTQISGECGHQGFTAQGAYLSLFRMSFVFWCPLISLFKRKSSVLEK